MSHDNDDNDDDMSPSSEREVHSPGGLQSGGGRDTQPGHSRCAQSFYNFMIGKSGSWSDGSNNISLKEATPTNQSYNSAVTHD